MAKSKADAPLFTKEDLIAAAIILGHTPDVMAAALHDINEPLTRAQAEEKVDAFLKKPVSNDEGGNK